MQLQLQHLQLLAQIPGANNGGSTIFGDRLPFQNAERGGQEGQGDEEIL
jgi:hypothetical protein